jgi:hypothetical protein
VLITIVSPQILSISLAGVASACIIIMLLIEYLTDIKVKPVLSQLSFGISIFIVPFLIIVFYFTIFGIAKIIAG